LKKSGCDPKRNIDPILSENQQHKKCPCLTMWR